MSDYLLSDNLKSNHYMNLLSLDIALLIAFLLDLLLGDPRWLPHPIRWFGKAIAFCDSRFNKGENRVFKGAAVTIILVSLTWFCIWAILKLASFNNYFLVSIGAIFVFYGIANRNLIEEGLKVNRILNKQGIEAGRKQLSYIVGRDTRALNKNQIRTAILETLAENLSDGVIAPLFFYAIGGVPAILAYKMAQTLDSMIGYKNYKYKDFGKFAARFDDLLNFIPARLTALLMVIVSLSWRGFIFIFKYGRKHSSPNAGIPEAALAGILNCRFGGPNVYHGKLVEKPFIGENARDIGNGDIYKAALINFGCALVMVGIIILMKYFIA